MKAFINHLKVHLIHSTHRIEQPLHIAYFGMVSFEAHHFYGIAAGGLLLVTLVQLLIKE